MPQAITYNQALPAVLPAVVAPGFQVRINQIARLFFQLDGNTIATTAAVKLKATWDTLIAAADATKVVYTPLCSNTKISVSKELATGSDTNTTYRGLPEYFGEGVARLSGSFRGKDYASLNSLVGLTQFSLMNSNGLSTLRCYFMNNDGHFILQDGTSTGLLLSGFRVYNFSLRSRGTEGLNAADVIDFTLDLEPNWDQYVMPVVPSFDPRLYV